MLRSTLLFFMFLSCFQTISWGADKAPAYTQKDLAHLIVKQLSWSAGLPKDPADRDYLMILGGKRSFRYEAENAYNEATDRVTIREFPLYGAFTGKGWLLGVSDTTDSTFTVLLPVAGEYRFMAVIKGNGFVWNIDGKEYRADSKSGNFSDTDIAKVMLKAGIVTIKVIIPPEGAIDSFSLKAEDYTPVQPFMGWRFREALTAGHMAEIAVALKNSYASLPDAGLEATPKPVAVFEKTVLPPSAFYTTDDFLGRFSSAKWIRANFMGAQFQIPLTVMETGYYGLTVNALGENISGSVNNTPFTIAGKIYLSKLDLGIHRLEAGDNTLSITLPPAGGIDSVEFSKKKYTPDDFLRLAGISGPADRLIGAEEAAALLKSIRSYSAIRR